MPVTKPFRVATEAKIAAVKPITSKAMFGGIAIYAGEHLFACLDNDRIYFKVDELIQPNFEAAGTQAFVPFPGAKPMGYFELPAGVIDRPDELAVWIDQSIGAAQRKAKLKSKLKRKKGP